MSFLKMAFSFTAGYMVGDSYSRMGPGESLIEANKNGLRIGKSKIVKIEDEGASGKKITAFRIFEFKI